MEASRSIEVSEIWQRRESAAAKRTIDVASRHRKRWWETTAQQPHTRVYISEKSSSKLKTALSMENIDCR